VNSALKNGGGFQKPFPICFTPRVEVLMKWVRSLQQGFLLSSPVVFWEAEVLQVKLLLHLDLLEQQDFAFM
jgi:hypothetical protein